MQLKYHETGKEKDCLPQVGQWNMMNKVSLLLLFLSFFSVSKFICLSKFHPLEYFDSIGTENDQRYDRYPLGVY